MQMQIRPLPEPRDPTAIDAERRAGDLGRTIETQETGGTQEAGEQTDLYRNRNFSGRLLLGQNLALGVLEALARGHGRRACACLGAGFPTATGAVQEDMANRNIVATATEEAVPAFEITAGDIARIHDLGGRLHIALTAPARKRFARFTADNKGRLARVVAGGVILIEAVVRAEIDSGLLSTDPLDDASRGQVLRLLIGG